MQLGIGPKKIHSFRICVCYNGKQIGNEQSVFKFHFKSPQRKNKFLKRTLIAQISLSKMHTFFLISATI
jgi:hypothetical protein